MPGVAEGADEAVGFREGVAAEVSRGLPAALVPRAGITRDPREGETSPVRPLGMSPGPRSFPPATSHDRVVDACHPHLRTDPPAASAPQAETPHSFRPAIGQAQRIDLPSLPTNQQHVREARSVRRKSQRVLRVPSGPRRVRAEVCPSGQRNSQPVRALASGLRRVREAALRSALRGGPRSFPPNLAPG